mmetsp:Transcript_45472/g.103000  ORF Transcript_45472/g.103000 Transcript_45472/m.103000 type:complete len:172 (+) Transcript_45472:198-713(+)
MVLVAPAVTAKPGGEQARCPTGTRKDPTLVWDSVAETNRGVEHITADGPFVTTVATADAADPGAAANPIAGAVAADARGDDEVILAGKVMRCGKGCCSPATATDAPMGAVPAMTGSTALLAQLGCRIAAGSVERSIVTFVHGSGLPSGPNEVARCALDAAQLSPQSGCGCS